MNGYSGTTGKAAQCIIGSSVVEKPASSFVARKLPMPASREGQQLQQFQWCPVRDSNPCYSLERAVS